MDIKAIFRRMLSLKQRKVNIERGDDVLANVYVSPSDYQRNLEGPSATAFKGREFIISREQLASPITSLKRGDVIVDSELGAMPIEEIVEMYDLGGAIIGFRLRTN